MPKHDTRLTARPPRLALLTLALMLGLAACSSTPTTKPSPAQPRSAPSLPEKKRPERAAISPATFVSGGEFETLMTDQADLQAHIRLVLTGNGEADLTIGRKPGEPPIIRTGTWRQSNEGLLIVAFSSENGAPLAQVVKWLLTPNGKDLEAKAIELPGFDSGPLRLLRHEERPNIAGGAFVGPIWVWVEGATPDEISLEFKEDGWFNFRTDCGEGTGMYETSGQEIALAAIHVIDDRCSGNAIHGRFLRFLEDAGRLRWSEDHLFLDLKHQPKTLIFQLRH